MPKSGLTEPFVLPEFVWTYPALKETYFIGVTVISLPPMTALRNPMIGQHYSHWGKSCKLRCFAHTMILSPTLQVAKTMADLLVRLYFQRTPKCTVCICQVRPCNTLHSFPEWICLRFTKCEHVNMHSAHSIYCTLLHHMEIWSGELTNPRFLTLYKRQCWWSLQLILHITLHHHSENQTKCYNNFK